MPTRQDLAQKAGLSYRLLGDLERGTRPVSEGSLAIVEQVLGWQPGSSKRILEGGEPRLAIDGPPVSAIADGLAVGQRTDASPTADRALDEAYRFASTMVKSGDDSAVSRFGEFLGDIGHSLVVSASGELDLAADGEVGPTASSLQPTVLRIALGRYLFDVRNKNGIGLNEIGDHLGCTEKSLSDVENGTAKFGRRWVRRALTAYGIGDPKIHREFDELAMTADRSGWWTGYVDKLPEWFESYIVLERFSDRICTFESPHIPGLLRTPEYARSVIRESMSVGVKRRVSVAMHRQQVLVRSGGLSLWALVDEAALYRSPEGADMQEQIQYLIDIGQRDNVTLQVLPVSSYPPSNPGPFTLLSLPLDGNPDVVYIEEFTSAIYIDRAREVDQYRQLFNSIAESAYSPEETTEFLQGLLSANGTGH